MGRGRGKSRGFSKTMYISRAKPLCGEIWVFSALVMWRLAAEAPARYCRYVIFLACANRRGYEKPRGKKVLTAGKKPIKNPKALTPKKSRPFHRPILIPVLSGAAQRVVGFRPKNLKMLTRFLMKRNSHPPRSQNSTDADGCANSISEISKRHFRWINCGANPPMFCKENF